MEAGYHVIGVDSEPQPEYIGDEFVQGDALEYIASADLSDVDAIHASPPCQAYSALKHRHKTAQHPDLIPATREALIKTGRPYVIENVVGAPLIEPTLLCGAMDEFPELRVIRHRLFESNCQIPQPEHRPHPLVVTNDKRKPHYRKLDPATDYVGVYGGNQGATVADDRDAMGIEWMTKKRLNQAIPPAYTRYIGSHLREYRSDLKARI
jgi:DNA (cytosine-5)-methyltransferase 1